MENKENSKLNLILNFNCSHSSNDLKSYLPGASIEKLIDECINHKNKEETLDVSNLSDNNLRQVIAILLDSKKFNIRLKVYDESVKLLTVSYSPLKKKMNGDFDFIYIYKYNKNKFNERFSDTSEIDPELYKKVSNKIRNCILNLQNFEEPYNKVASTVFVIDGYHTESIYTIGTIIKRLTKDYDILDNYKISGGTSSDGTEKLIVFPTFIINKDFKLWDEIE